LTSIREKLNAAVVAIAGLGGLGSNVAIALARAGVGRLIIADFDTVEQSNLNRQQYFIDQIGKPKVDCMIENLRRINPAVKVSGHRVKLDADNISQLFADADVIAECFDSAIAKQMIVETVLSKMAKSIIVTVSGLAGYGKSNAIQTRRISPRLVLVGDGARGIDTCKILTAARVGIAAMHQANAIIELLIDEINPSQAGKNINCEDYR
jgi:sulfur carrier protein ThiS adenylyltransferase